MCAAVNSALHGYVYLTWRTMLMMTNDVGGLWQDSEANDCNVQTRKRCNCLQTMEENLWGPDAIDPVVAKM